MFASWFRKKPPPEYLPCPHCGAMVVETASFCRHCGASEDSGWSAEREEHSYDEDDFDYNEFLENEFPDQVVQRKPDFKKFVIVVLLVCFAIACLWGF